VTTEASSGAGQRPSSAHITALDGMRGVAILLVMQFHFWGLGFSLAGRGPATAIDRYALRVAHVGWSGVDMFFVLSGFLITGILYDAKGAGGFFRNFYARRILRIFPLYYGFLLFVVVVLPHLPPLDPPAAISNVRENPFWYFGYLVNIWTAVEPLHGQIALVHSPFWSLAVEEQFYLIWPAFVLLLDRRNLLRACALLVVGAFALRLFLIADVTSFFSSNAAHVLMPARMDTFALGALIALALRGGELQRVARWAPLAAAGALVVLAALFVARDGLSPVDRPVQTLGFSALAILFAALLTMTLAPVGGVDLAAVLRLPPLTFIGRYAYGIYVCHLLVAFELSVWMLHNDLLRTAFGSQIPLNVLFSATATAISVLIAWLSWHLYEKQFLKLKRFFPYGGSGDRPLRTAATGPARQP
jgi:peptidoglycan/LPS O-acetylase OafA/YrhL